MVTLNLLLKIYQIYIPLKLPGFDLNISKILLRSPYLPVIFLGSTGYFLYKKENYK